MNEITALLPARTNTGGHPALMTIGRSPAGYRPVRSRDDALRPMGPDAEHAWRLLSDIKAAWSDAPRGLKDTAQVPYSLERAMQAAQITKRSVGGQTYRERIAVMLRWLDVQGAIQFSEGDQRWSILLCTTPAALQYNPLGEWRYESQQQASELLVLWQRLWAARWHEAYQWPPDRVGPPPALRWINEVRDSHRFLTQQLECGVARELIAQVYLGYITGHVQWPLITGTTIPIYNAFKWHGGRPKPVGLTTCHAHFDRLLRDVRDAIEVQANALDQDPPLWLYEQPDETDRRQAVQTMRLQRSSRRRRLAGKPAPSDAQIVRIVAKRNQPKNTRLLPPGSDHAHEALDDPQPPPARCPAHGDRHVPHCAGCAS